MATAIDLLRGILNGFRALNSKGVYSSNAAKTDLLRQILLEVQTLGGLHPDTENYLSRVAAVGGSVSSLKQAALDTAIRTIYTSGLRGSTNFLKYWLCLNLTNSFTGSLVPVYDDGVGNAVNNNFVAGDWSSTLGLTGDATSKYLNSNWNPTTQLGAFSLAGRFDAHFSCWVTNWIDAAPTTAPRQMGYDSGSAGATDGFQILYDDLGNFIPYLSAPIRVVPTGVPIPSPRPKHILVNRFGSGAASGRFLADNDLLVTSGNPPPITLDHTGSIFLFCLNRNNGTGASRLTDQSISNFTMGYGLSLSHESALYNILNTFVTAIGV